MRIVIKCYQQLVHVYTRHVITCTCIYMYTCTCNYMYMYMFIQAHMYMQLHVQCIYMYTCTCICKVSVYLLLTVHSLLNTYVSLPCPHTAIRLLSGDQHMSLICPANGWYSYFSICSLFTVSQIRILPETSKEERIPIKIKRDSSKPQCSIIHVYKLHI